jgi:hypothetical protein
MLLEHIKGIVPDTELNEEITKLEEEFAQIVEAMPEPGKVEGGENLDKLMGAMDTVMQQLDAAKRGLGILNKMADSPLRTKNRSRVMGNLNKIRANLKRVEKMFSAAIDEDPELRAELDYQKGVMAGKY